MASPNIVKAPKRVISLLRVSKAEQEKNGPARQRSINKRTAEMYGLNIVEEMTVSDVSGRHVNTSRQFQRLFARLQQPDIDGVVAAEQSRMVRMDKYSDLGIFDQFVDGKLIWFPDGPVNPKSPTQRITVMVKAAIDGNELGVILSRTEETKENMRKAGECVTGNHGLPVGVKFIRERDEDGKIVRKYWKHIEPHASLMKMAFELADAGGMSFEDIAAKMANGWNQQRLRRSLVNPIWIGRRRYDTAQRGAEVQPTFTRKPLPDNREPRHYKKKVARKPDEVIEVPIDLPAIVSEDLFERVRSLVVGRKIAWKHRTRKHNDCLLRGIARCTCGQVLYLNRSWKYRSDGREAVNNYYYCSSREKPKCAACASSRTYAHQKDVDAAVIRMLREELMKAVAVIAARTKKLVKPDNRSAVKTYEFQMAKLKMQLENITESMNDGLMSSAKFKAKRDALQAAMAQLRAKQPTEEQQPDIRWNELETLIAGAFARLPYLDFDRQLALVKSAVRGVVLDPMASAIHSVTLYSGFCAAATVKEQLCDRSAAKSFLNASDLTITFDKPLEIRRSA